jgi:glyoxylase-like metal-dependent hydrolase (beta-lactamase superfamily II)
MAGVEINAATAVGSTTQVADDIWRIVLPTPFPVGPVNVYVIEDEPLTLVDTGPVDAASRDVLEAGLAQLGHAVEDLERVFVSHQHIDHWGLTAELAARSGAEVVALAAFGDWLSRFPESLADEDRFAEALLRRHGIDPESRTAGVYRGDKGFGAAVMVTHPRRDSEQLQFARRTLQVLHRPGHSPSDTVLYDSERALMLGADHVMLKPPVSILSPPLDGASPPQRRPRAMADSRASLRLTAAMEIDRILPGHGDVVDDPRAAINRHLGRLDRMTARVHDALTAEPRPAIDIAREVRGEVAGYAAFFVLCETLGSLDELIDGGVAVETEADGVVGFHRISDSRREL